MKIKEKVEDFIVQEVLSLNHKKNDCLVFTLEKENWDTIGVIKVIARELRISQKRLGYAGLKDKRAVTRQKISVFGVTKEQLEEVNLKIPRIKIYDIEEGDRIRLGDHLGNEFNILVRDAHFTFEILKKVKNGFPNYFGVQRFGEVRPVTHEVGRELVKGNFEKAAFLFLAKPFEKDRYYPIRKALWDTHDFKEAKMVYPPSLMYERAMLDRIHLGFKEAFKALPLRLNTLFIHAYQAHLFNTIVERRCKQVAVTEVEPKDVVIASIEGRKVFTLAGKHNLDKIKKEGLCAAAPILGYKTQVRGRMKEITESVLEEEGIKKEDFRIKEFPSLSSRGTYREILARVSDFSYAEEKEGVRLKFFLPKGQYATVFLEELFRR